MMAKTTIGRGGHGRDWMSTKEASSRLGITPRMLYRLIDQGNLNAYKFGRNIRLRHDEVEAYIRDQRG